MTTAKKIIQEKIVARKIEELSYIVGDWNKIEYIPLKNQAAKEILARARELISAADELEEKPVKSEMPCNCAKVSPMKILDNVIADVKSKLEGTSKIAVIIFDERVISDDEN